MPYECLIYEKAAGIAKITINRPQVLNAINLATLHELKAALEQAGSDREARVVVLTGAGRAFSAGVDLVEMNERLARQGTVGTKLDEPARDVTRTIQALPKVVIAMVNGYCLTGALEIALSCDLIVASEEARLGDTHAKWGVVPTWGMSQRLPRLLGVLKAKELSFTARMITGREAASLGLVNLAVPAERLETAVQELAQEIMANSPDTVAAIKSLYNRGLMDTLEGGLSLEATSHFTIRDTVDRVPGFRKKG